MQRVVTLVVEHAVNRGSESLMVVTAYAYESDVGYHLSYVVFPYSIDVE